MAEQPRFLILPENTQVDVREQADLKPGPTPTAVCPSISIVACETLVVCRGMTVDG